MASSGFMSSSVMLIEHTRPNSRLSPKGREKLRGELSTVKRVFALMSAAYQQTAPANVADTRGHTSGREGTRLPTPGPAQGAEPAAGDSQVTKSRK